jgi:hypothetical protein
LTAGLRRSWRQVTASSEKFYEISFNHCIAFLRASDVAVG